MPKVVPQRDEKQIEFFNQIKKLISPYIADCDKLCNDIIDMEEYAIPFLQRYPGVPPSLAKQVKQHREQYISYLKQKQLN